MLSAVLEIPAPVPFTVYVPFEYVALPAVGTDPMS
jgi:hypothetical protein